MAGRTLIQALFLLVLFIICFWGTFWGIVNTWITNDDYSYGFLIPLISAYFIWEDRKKIRDVKVSQDFRAFPFLALFMLFSVYGILGSSYSAVRPSIPFILFFLTMFCFGKYAARLMALPIGFLVFMVPIPVVMNRYVGEPLKIVSSKLGTIVIRVCGISVHTSGNFIDLGFTQLQVVDACSGLRFLFPLMALGVVYAYFFERVTWKRVVSVLATLPIAVMVNGLRVGITGILSSKWGSRAAEGFFHAFEGWALFMVAFAFLFGLGRILKYLPDGERQKNTSLSEEEATTMKPVKVSNQQCENPPLVTKNRTAFVLSIILFAGIGALSWSTSALPPVQIRGGIESFPLEIGDWRGDRIYVSNEIVIASGAEESFNATYHNEYGERVELYLGYRSTPFLEDENFFHTPIACFPASGWKILKKNTYTFEHKFNFLDLKATEMVAEKMGIKNLVFFWFQTNKKATHDKNKNRLHLALHAIKRENTHDLFVRLITPIISGKTQEAEQRLDEFAFQFNNVLNTFLREHQFTKKP